MQLVSQTPEYDHLVKMLLVGDASVGKSSLLLRFCGMDFSNRQFSTIGVDFRTRYVSIENRTFKCALWDSAGQERFRTLTASYYRGAHGIILVYDVSQRSTFESLPYWMEEVSHHSTNPDAVVLIIANKIDVPDRKVTQQEGLDFAFRHSAIYVETSAKTYQGVTHAFEELLLKIGDSERLLRDTAVTPKGLQIRNSQPERENVCCS